jgi:ribosomal protein S18 acetylase RimI-like enzyme
VTPTLIPLSAADPDWTEALLAGELAGRMQARLGALVDATAGDGLVALEGGAAPVGLVTWMIEGPGSSPGEAEIRVLVVDVLFRGRGVGSALLAAAEAALARSGVVRAWLVTTNDNLAALRFYQRRGWRLAALHPGAVDVARLTVKPGIPPVGDHGLPIHDELVLHKEL